MPLQSRFRSRRSQVALLACVCTVVAAVLWLSGALGGIPNRRIVAAMDARRLQDAEAWLMWSNRWRLSNAETKFLEARLFRKFGQLDAAATALQQAAQKGVDAQRIDRQRVLLRAQSGQVTDVADQLGGLLVDQQGEGDGADVCEAYVNGWLMVGDVEQAMVLIDEWKSAYPRDAQAWYAAARADQFYGNRSAARSEYEQALSRQPQHYPSAFALGVLLLEDRQVEQAQALFDRCRAMQFPAAPTTEYARCLWKRGDVEMARALLRQVNELPDNDVQLSYRRLGILRQGQPAAQALGEIALAEQNFEEAYAMLRRASQADPQHLETRYQLALALRGLGRNEEAQTEMAEVARLRKVVEEIQALEAALVLTEPEIDKRYRIGSLYLDEEISDELGEFWLKSVLTFAPDHRQTHEGLARYYSRRATQDPGLRRLAQQHRRLAQQP